MNPRLLPLVAGLVVILVAWTIEIGLLAGIAAAVFALVGGTGYVLYQLRRN